MTDTVLADILPRTERRLRVRKIEEYLGFKLNLLRPPDWVIVIFVIIFLASPIVGVFFNWKIGLSGLCFSIFGMKIAGGIGNELNSHTVGQVVDKMTRKNYIKSRRNPNTFNREEVEKILID